MQTVHAIYENGIFRPIEPVHLPDQTAVEFEPRLVGSTKDDNRSQNGGIAPSDHGLDAVYKILSERYASGYTDTAARHNEHQP